MRLFNWKKVVDEREQMEMFRVEHYVCWLTFWALLVSIFVQLIGMRVSFSQVAGEWIVFMVMAFGILIGDMKGGHFEYYSRPGWKSYLFYTLVATVAVIVLGFLRGMIGGYYRNLSDAVLAALILGGNTFVLTYVALAAAGAFVKHRRRQLESEYEEEEEEER